MLLTTVAVVYTLDAIAVLRTAMTRILAGSHGRTAGSEVVTVFGQAFNKYLGTFVAICVALAAISKLGTAIFLFPTGSQRRTASSAVFGAAVRAEDGNETRRAYRQ